MRHKGIFFVFILIFINHTARAEEILIDIIIAGNVERGRDHYVSATAEANRILSACNGVTVKINNVRKFTNGIGLAAIADEETRKDARDAAVLHGANVLVVNDLKVCGSLSEPKSGNIVGCAAPDSALTIETFEDPALEGRTIAHEIGHSGRLMWHMTPGKPHSDNSGYLMYRALERQVETPAISEPECERFRSLHSRYYNRSNSNGPEAVTLVEDTDFSTVSVAIPEITTDLDVLLENIWYGEILSEELKQIMEMEGSIAQLRTALINNSSLTKKQNAAYVLGEYGEPSDILLLQASLSMSHSGSDKADLQRFTSSAITAIARLGVRHENMEAVEIIQKILAEVLIRDSSSLPAFGLNESQQIDVMSSAATTVLQVSEQLEDAGLIDAPEALVFEDYSIYVNSGNIPDAAAYISENSGLNIDQNFLSRVFSTE